MKSLLSGFSEMRSFFSIRRSAEQFSFSIDSTKNSGLIRLILLTFLAFAAIQGEIRAQIEQRGSATTNAVALSGTGRTIAINKPTGVVAGDVLIASIVQNEGDNDAGGLSNATLSGWTLIRGGLIRSDGTSNGNNAWWGTFLYRIADGTEGDSFSFSMPNDRADMAIGSIVAFSGVSTTGGVGPSGTGTGPFDVATSSFTTGNDDTPTVSGITVSSDAAVVFLAQVNNDRSYSSWVDGSNSLSLTELFDNFTANGDDASVGAAWGIISSAGSTGTTEVTISGSNRWGAVLLALRQAPIQKRFRSATTGNWSTNSTWQQSTNGGTSWVAATSTPTAADISVTIQNSHTVTLTAAASSPTLTINSGGTLIPGANLLTLNENFISNGTLTSGSGGITLAGTSDQSIAGFTTTGTVSMTKTGGTATFQGNVNGAGLTINGNGGILNLGSSLTHTFTGTWTMENGDLEGGSSTLKISGGVSINNGNFTEETGTVEYNGAAQTVLELTYNNLIITNGNTKTLNDNATVNGILTVAASTTLSLSTFTLDVQDIELSNGATTGSIISGTGVLALAGDLSVVSDGLGTSGATISSRLTLSGTRTFTVADDGTDATDLTISGVISSTGSLTKAGSGTLVLSGSNTYTGVTRVNEGILSAATIVVSSSASNLGNATSAVILGSASTSGILRYTGAAATFTRGITVSAGGGGVTNTSSNLLTIGTGGIANGGQLTFSNTSTGGTTVSSVISSTGSVVVNNSGTGVTTFSGSNTYTGSTTISAGTLSAATIVVASSASSLGNATSAVILGSASTAGILSYTGAAATFTRGITVNAGGGGVTNTTSNLLTIGTGGVVNGGQLTFSNTGTGGTTVSSVISSTGSVVVNNSGTGVTTFSAANTYTGATVVNGGNLKAGVATSSFGSNSAVTLANTSGVVLDITGFNNTIGSLTGGGATGGNVTLGAATLTIGTNDSSPAAFAGIISGTGAITKSGIGVLVFSGVNTYTGTTTISGGTLRYGASNAIASGAVTVNDGATFDLNGFSDTIGALTVRSGISGGSVTTGAGTLTLGGTVTSTGGAANASISGNLALGANRNFSITNAADELNISAIISGAFTLIKQGNGTLNLSGTNTYTGATTVSVGVLNVRNAQGTGTTAGGVTVASGAALELQGGITVGAETLSLNNTGVSSAGALRNISGDNTWGGRITLTTNAARINSDAGTLTLNASNAITATNIGLTVGGAGNTTISGTITTGSGSLTKVGAGTLTLSGANTYTGATTVTEGILQLGAADRIANASNLILNGGTFRSGASAGVAETMGTVSLSENSTIALGTGDHTLLFSASSGATWSAGRTLAVTGWTGSAGASGTAGKLRIGTTTSGLSTSQLSQFRFDGFEDGAMLLANGEVVPPSVLPVITSPLTASSNYGTAATYTITASNSPTSFNATGLPAGMSVNTTTGEITVGAEINAGTYSITISATSGAGTDTKTLVYTVNRAASTVTVKSGTTSSFTFTGSAQGPGVSNFDFTGSTGDLSVLYTGVAPTTYNSATPPTNAGSYQVIATVAADDNFNAASSSAFAFAITKATVAITPDSGQFKIIGEAEPILRYQSTGWIGPDTSSQLVGSLSRTEGEVQGNYPITLGTLVVTNPNYSLAFTSGVSFEIRNIPATQYIISVNTISPRAGTAVTITAQLADQNGNAVAESGRILTWSELIGASGSFSSTTSVTNAQGIATVQFTTSSSVGVSTNITASGSGGLFGTSPEITTVDAVPTQLVFIQDPSNSTTEAGQSFITQPIVHVQDAEGNLVSGANGLVTLSLLEGTGELRGTIAINAVNGVATFSGLNIDLMGSDKVLLVEAEGLESDTTAAFTITPAQASLFTKYAGDQQVAQVGTALDIPPAVRIQDIFGNPISGVSVSFSVTSGGGSIQPTTEVVTDSDGIASLTSWTLGTTAGQNALIASTQGLSPTTFTALGSEDANAEFSTSGTWTVPLGVTEIIVEVWGAGGAGGGVNGSNGNTRLGGGGGGGAYAKSKLEVIPGNTLTIVVGQGGAPTGNNQNGPDGGSSYLVNFENELFAEGGNGGLRINSSGDPATGGAGGSIAGSKGGLDIRPGQAGNRGGQNNFSNVNNTDGKGGDSGYLGIGGALISYGNGIIGNAPGGGGSGGASNSSTDRRGGTGGSGRIIITYPRPVNQFRAATSGNWEDAATWEQQFSNGQFAKIDTKPGASSSVIISNPAVSVQGAPAAVTVTVSNDLNFTGSITVTAEGELKLASGKNLTLTSGSVLTIGNEGILTLPANGLVLGAGNVAINRGSTFSIAHPDGVKATGTSGGAIQNTGTRTFSAEANYHYNGTAAQVIGNGLPAIVNGLTIDNSTTVTLDRPLEVKLDMGVNSGVFELNETLTIDFGMTLNGTSQVLVKPGKTFQADLLANLTTNATSRIVINPGAKYLNLGISTPRLEVQQRLTGARGWRMLGAPVTGANYQSFLTGLESQGFPGSANPTLQANVLWWDEQDGGTTVQSWRQPGNISQSVPAGRGHYVFVFNGATKKAAGSGNYSDALPLTLSTIGDEVNLNNGGFNFGVTFTERNEKFQGNTTTTGDYSLAGDANEGFNLIANPTSSDIDFFKSTGWTKTKIDQTIYIWDQNYNNGQGDFIEVTSETALANRIIAPYQAFWVRTNGAAPSLIMNNEVKAAEFSAFYGRVLADVPATPGSKINLRLSGEGMLADASIRISEQGEDGLDPWDAFQLESLNNNWLNLYTLGSPKELTPLVINHLSMPEEGEKTIPLYMAAAKAGKAFSGNYTLNWALPADLPADTRVVLMDHISKQAIDMSEIQSYTFSFQAPTTTNARIRTDDGEMKQPQAVVFSHEIKEGTGENYRTAAGQVTRPFTIVIGYTGQGTDPEYRPETPKLYTPSPNPFQEMTQIKFYIPVAEEVEVKVYDMKGQEVGSFERETYPAGINFLEWRPSAVQLPKGMYLIQVQTSSTVMSQKVIKL